MREAYNPIPEVEARVDQEIFFSKLSGRLDETETKIVAGLSYGLNYQELSVELQLPEAELQERCQRILEKVEAVEA